ncbi:MAG: hypothetical protein H7338_21525 [Candidatus Sericytochromatia bacterium]|nr:hypothetical protein [Candidatus Sericytochromatia bacterium]
MAVVPSSGLSPGGASAYDRWQTMVQSTKQGMPSGAKPIEPHVTRLQGRNLVFGAGDSLKLSMPQLDADIIDLTPADPLNMDDRASWQLNIRGAEVMLTDGQITTFLRAQLGDSAKAVQNLQIRFLPDNKLEVTGKATKLHIGFTVKADIRLDDKKRMALVPTSIKFGILSLLPLAKTFNLNIEKLAKFSDKQGRFGITGNNFWIDPAHLSDSPKIVGTVSQVRSQQGFLSIYMGKADAVHPLWLPHAGNYATLTGGHLITGGQIIKNPEILLRDKTANDPFNMDDEPGRTTTVVHGEVTLPQAKLNAIIDSAVGDGDTFQVKKFSMTEKGAKINGTLKGFLPVEIYLRFARSKDGMLKIEPHGGKLSFIPIPGGLLRSIIGGMLKGSTKEGDGFVVGPDMLGSTQLGQLISVTNTNGALELKI